jgi:hypothetical protein
MKKQNKKSKKVPRKSASKRLVSRLKFLPLVAVLGFGLWAGGFPLRSSAAVLAYSTEMSQGGLLSSTNAQRSAHGVAGLALNAQLNSAAQSKANDMVTRNYWSHNTPDGQPPWVFFAAAGYQYLKAGENLAYGFATSADTVTGWMNSPGHKANLLDGAFKDVGFGFANSTNFVGSGPVTVVVAMYGNPIAQSTPPPTPPPAAPTTPASPPTPPQPTPTPAPTPEPAPEPEATPAETPASAPSEEGVGQLSPTSENAALIGSASQPVNRLQLANTHNSSLAMAVALSGAAAMILLWALNHLAALHRAIVNGEHYVLRHIHLDLTVLAIVAVALVLRTPAGFIL